MPNSSNHTTSIPALLEASAFHFAKNLKVKIINAFLRASTVIPELFLHVFGWNEQVRDVESLVTPSEFSSKPLFTYIPRVDGGAGLDEHLDHVVVLPPARQVERRVVQRLLHVLDLRLSLVREQLPAHVDVARVDRGEQRDVAILREKKG